MERRRIYCGKIEVELIRKANRLQLMKQDLEKTETVFLSSASASRKSIAVQGGAYAVPGDASGNKSYQKEDGYVGVPKQIRKEVDMRAKLGIMMGYEMHTKGFWIWLRDENKLIEIINVRFDENTEGIHGSQNSNRYTKFNFTIADYSDDEDDFDTVIYSLSSRLIPETSSESPSTSRHRCGENTKSEKLPDSAHGQKEDNIVEVRIILNINRQLHPKKHPNGMIQWIGK
ncbi:hypothetical protein AVEN_46828-1 [Araneus ventricosus]|uniref:Retroviral polymerase SH3-like domain-containing protein n=1 Tax=Araneus ventricosus TaxID=182803 RepID=A0A4Y2SF22_ARAVE|nr:hypothetical protein AVEN_46828-1 [Araneus ventricosus]